MMATFDERGDEPVSMWGENTAPGRSLPKPSCGGATLIRRAIWLFLGKTLAFLVSFVLPILLVRQMSQTEFGLYKQVFLAVNTMVTVLPLGFAMSAFYFLPRESSRRGQVIFNIAAFYLLAGAAAGLMLIFRPELLAALFASPELTDYAPEVGAVVLFWMASSFLEMVAVAHGEAYFAALFVAGAHLSRALLLLAAVLWVGSLRSLIHAALIHGILQTGALWLYLDSRFPGFWRRFDWTMLRSQLSYALPMGAAALLWIIQSDLHNYFVSHRFGAAAFAIYAIGCFQLPFIGILQESVGAVMILRVSELQKQGNVREILLLTARMMRKLALLLFPMYLFLLVTRREVIVFLFTGQYLASVPLFAINLTMIPLGMVATAYDPIIRAYPEHLPFLLMVRTVLGMFLLAGLWFGTEHFCLEGAIAAVVGVNIIERFVLGFKAGRVLGASWHHLSLFKDVGKLALASLAAGAVAAAVREWAVENDPFVILLLCGIAFGVTYVAAVLPLGVLTSEERGVIQQKIADASKWVSRRKRQCCLRTLR